MNTTKFHGKLLAKALVCTTALAALQLDSHPRSSDQIKVLRLSKVQQDFTASAQKGAPRICWKWQLTKAQAEAFFRLSKPIDYRTYIHEYDTAPCKVTGTLNRNGETWSFSINGAAKASLTRGGKRIHIGCNVAACAELVMWVYDSDQFGAKNSL